jgi:hypothetical protein
MKPQSVRSQRSFTEHMQTLYQNIDTLVYAAEVACGKEGGSEYRCVGMTCPFRVSHSGVGFYKSCKLEHMRIILGEHFPQHDIKTVELSE